MMLKLKQIMAKLIDSPVNMAPYMVIHVLRIVIILIGVPSGGIPPENNILIIIIMVGK